MSPGPAPDPPRSKWKADTEVNVLETASPTRISSSSETPPGIREVRKRGGRRTGSCYGALILALALPVGTAAQGRSAELRSLESRLDQARAAAVHLLAPRAFEEAFDRYEDVSRWLRDGREDEEARERLDVARARLAGAEAWAEDARGFFSQTLAARVAAIEVGAGVTATQSWQGAEGAFEDGGRRFEREDREGAARFAAQAEQLYRQATRTGWRDRLLGAAIQARAAAMSAGASELAPVAFGEGERRLATGEEGVAAGRTGAETAAAGQAAVQAFEYSSRIAALADSVRRRGVTVERLVAAHEADLAGLARTAGVEATRGETAETTDRVATEIRSLQSEGERLVRELTDERATSADLAARLDALETRLAASEERFAIAREELLNRRLRENRLREAQGLFTPAEAEVFVSGDRLVLRLFGLTFESGSDEILPEHEALLTKVQRVITTFGGAAVRIEGHTDSQGRAESNKALSQRRAIAVREHLLSRIPIPSSRVEAAGFGEERPIASNETDEGRAKNRRIEVVVTLPR